MSHDETGDEWVDLGGMFPVRAFAVHAIVTMSETGAGRAVLVSLMTDDDGTNYQFVMQPNVAGRIGYEMVGNATGYLAEFVEDTFNPGGEDDDV